MAAPLALRRALQALVDDAAGEAAAEDAFSVLCSFLEEPAGAEAVLSQLVKRLGEGGPSSRAVQQALSLLCRLLLSGHWEAGEAATSPSLAVLQAALEALAVRGGGEGEEEAACLRDARLLSHTLLRWGVNSAVQPEAAAAQQPAPASAEERVPADLLAWRWGGAAQLRSHLPPPRASLRYTPGCSLSLVVWAALDWRSLPGGEAWLGAESGAGEEGGDGPESGGGTGDAELPEAEDDEPLSPRARALRLGALPLQSDSPSSTSLAQLQPRKWAGVLDSHTTRRHLAEIRAERASRRGEGEADPLATLRLESGDGPQLRPRLNARLPPSSAPPLNLSLSDAAALIQIASAGRPPPPPKAVAQSAEQAPAPPAPAPTAPWLAAAGGRGGVSSRRALLLSVASGPMSPPPLPPPPRVTASFYPPRLPDAASSLLVRSLVDQREAHGWRYAAGPAGAVLRSMVGSESSAARAGGFDLLLNLCVCESGEGEGEWLPRLLGDSLLQLCERGEGDEAVWTAAAAAAFTLCAAAGGEGEEAGGCLHLGRARAALPLPALRCMLEVGRGVGWPAHARVALLCAACRLLYEPQGAEGDHAWLLDSERLRLLGGASWLARNVAHARSSAERAALLTPLLDLALSAPPPAAPAPAPVQTSSFARLDAFLPSPPEGGSGSTFHPESEPVPLPPATIAAALWRCGGADALACLAASGQPGAAAAVADGLCAAFPDSVGAGEVLHALAPQHNPPQPLLALESMFAACAAPPLPLAQHLEESCSPERLRGCGAPGGAEAEQGPSWSLLAALLRSGGAQERRDGAAWLGCLLREWALGEELGAASALPHPDSPLGILCAETARPPPAPFSAAPPPLLQLTERLLLSLAPACAPGWAAGLLTLEDCCERMLEACVTGEQRRVAAGHAFEALIRAMLCAPPDEEVEEEEDEDWSQHALPRPPRAEGGCAATDILSGRCAVPMPLLRSASLPLLLRLLEALSDFDPALLPPSDHHTRAALSILLLQRCGESEQELEEAGGEAAVRHLASDADARVAYAAAQLLLQRLQRSAPGAYRAGLRRLALRAQREDDERVLNNPWARAEGLALF